MKFHILVVYQNGKGKYGIILYCSLKQSLIKRQSNLPTSLPVLLITWDSDHSFSLFLLSLWVYIHTTVSVVWAQQEKKSGVKPMGLGMNKCNMATGNRASISKLGNLTFDLFYVWIVILIRNSFELQNISVLWIWYSAFQKICLLVLLTWGKITKSNAVIKVAQAWHRNNKGRAL